MSFAKREHLKSRKMNLNKPLQLAKKSRENSSLTFFLNTDTLYSLCCTKPLASDHANNKYYMGNFYNLIGLQQWYFSLI